jgi:hypothetical protein
MNQNKVNIQNSWLSEIKYSILIHLSPIMNDGES